MEVGAGGGGGGGDEVEVEVGAGGGGGGGGGGATLLEVGCTFCTAATEGSAEEDGGGGEAGAGDGDSIGAEVGTTVGSAEVDGILVTRSTVEVRYGAPFSSTYTTTSATVSVTNTTSVRIARFASSQVSWFFCF